MSCSFFVFSFSLFVVSVPCARLSWPSRLRNISMHRPTLECPYACCNTVRLRRLYPDVYSINAILLLENL